MTVSRNTVRLLAMSWMILALAGLALVGAFLAHSGFGAVAAHDAGARDAAGLARTGHGAGGAALIRAALPAAAAGDIAAPAAGVTGTTALPDLPIPALVTPADMGVVPAAAFSVKASSILDQQRARECLTAAIYYEAASEPDAGQSAVAQVILNRVRHPAFPATVCGVVYQGSEHAGCQFSFACDGAMARAPMRSAWVRAARAANMALAGYVYAPVGLATHYHTYAVTPSWNRSLVMTDVVGAHFFHRWKGFWGTAAAFTQRYRGGEPVPGPHMRVIPAEQYNDQGIDPKLLAAAALVAMPAPVIDAAQVRTAYADSGSYVAATPAAPLAAPAARPGDNLPPASQILDKWKDSGKPLM